MKKKPKIKTAEDLKKYYPDTYNACLQDGILCERDRIQALFKMSSDPMYEGIEQVQDVIVKAVEDGLTPIECSSMISETVKSFLVV